MKTPHLYRFLKNSFTSIEWHLKTLKRSVFYFGFQYRCPICRRHLRKFLNLGSVLGGKFIQGLDIRGEQHPVSNYETLNTKQFFCPVCGAQDKARLYALFLQRALPKKVPENYLLVHFAPESGLPDLIINHIGRKHYRSADLYRSDVDDRADLANLSIYRDNSIDAFICSHILEHIKNDKVAISELYRVLKPGHWGLLMVPILLSIEETYEDDSIDSDEGRLRHFGLEDHLRVYSKMGFISLMTSVGFKIEQQNIETFGESIFKMHGIEPRSVLYIVRKPVTNE